MLTKSEIRKITVVKGGGDDFQQHDDFACDVGRCNVPIPEEGEVQHAY